jgi:3',5'-cyclic AMP phosphodiesterase CpdA
MKIIQITDIHLVDRDEHLHGLDPTQRLKACIRDINTRNSDADLCILTGDLSHNGTIGAYENLRRLLDDLSIPYHFMMGNHDNRENFFRVFPEIPRDEKGFLQSVIDTATGRFLLLDTVEQGQNWGSYCGKRRQWLEAQLELSGEQPVYLFMHHPPFEIGIPCLDRIRLLDNADQIHKILEPYNNIKHIFFGHVHRPVAGSWNGIPFSMIRGTNHQVPYDLAAFDKVPKSHEPPSYGIILLEPEQTIVHFHDYLRDSGQGIPQGEWLGGQEVRMLETE